MEVLGCILETVREDDFVEYFLFPELSAELKSIDHQDKAAIKAVFEYLTKVKSQYLDFVEALVKERHYIWHKDKFNLEVSCNGNNLNDHFRRITDGHTPHLHGVTYYGDNLLDEWFIVYLLKELTLKYPRCVARIIDEDGEFLLIEAAEYLPKWANPETCKQRVYIAHGLVHIIENAQGLEREKMQSISDAIHKIRTASQLYRATKDVQKCINERLADFRDAASIAKQHHHQIVRLPLRAAALLQKREDFIAPAVRAFCDRDSNDKQVLRTMRFFPPEECMLVRVRFTRCLYAMTLNNKFIIDKRTGWKLNAVANSEEYKEDLLGVKIACGFEILAANAKNDYKTSPAWLFYLKNLTSKGYFRNLLQESEEYQQLYDEALNSFKQITQSYHTVGCEILSILEDFNYEQINGGNDHSLLPSDSDNWMINTSAGLDETFKKRYSDKILKSGISMTAEELTTNLGKFLDKQSAFSGIELNNSESDTSDDDQLESPKNKTLLSQNPNVTSTTTESTEMRSVLEFEVPEDNWGSNSDMEDYGNEDEMERTFADMACIDKDIKYFMSQMDHELAKTTIGQSFEKKKKHKESYSSDDDFGDIEEFEPININANTLKNMMESFSSQEGEPGPASIFLNSMGLGMSYSKRPDHKNTKNLKEAPV